MRIILRRMRRMRRLGRHLESVIGLCVVSGSRVNGKLFTVRRLLFGMLRALVLGKADKVSMPPPICQID